MKPIAKLATLALTAVVFIATSADKVAAQGEADPEPALVGFATWDVMPTEAQALLDEAEALLGQRKYNEARKNFEQAAEIIRAEGGFPAIPLRRIAKSYYHQGRLQTAVALLDDLARQAADVGDIGTQAWALADAAWVMGIDCSTHSRAEHPGARLEMLDRSKQIRMLLASPYLPDDVRGDIVRARCGGCHSAEKPPQWARK
ncbi:MAG: tetratricopeptide repeat protein [Gemmatimonadales bacterium]|jgi:tetratricopeptide (TPR) repeat protein